MKQLFFKSQNLDLSAFLDPPDPTKLKFLEHVLDSIIQGLKAQMRWKLNLL